MPLEGETSLPGGGSVAWCEWGDPAGEPLILLHGTPGSRLFYPDPALTGSAGLRVLTLDRPGYGRSTPMDLPSLLGVAERVARLAEDRGLERFSVVGFSGGAPAALACGAALGDRVTRVAAVSGAGPIDELADAYAGLSADERAAVAEIRADPAGARERLWELGRWYVETPLRMLDRTPDPADRSILTDPAIRSMYVASNLEGARQGQAGMISDWVAEALPWGFRLADIGVPVDLWVGEQDPARAPLDAPEIARRIPACTVHSDPDAGHWLLMSHWPEIAGRSVS